MKRVLLTLLTMILMMGAYAQQAAVDSIYIKGMMIIKGRNAEGKNVFKVYQDTAYARAKLKKNLHTRWLVFDVGFNNYRDNSNYSGAMAMSLYSSRASAFQNPNTPANYDFLQQLNAYNSKAQYDFSGSALNSFAPRRASSPLTPDEFKLITGKSINFNIWLLMQRLNIHKHKLNLIYALGTEMNNYRFARNITYIPGYPTTIIRDSVSFTKNKLFASYLTIPVMLNFNSNPARPGRSFELSAGVSGGYLLKSRTKQVSEERGKERHTDDFSLNKWRFGLTGEIAYGPIKLYTNFALTPLHDYGLEQYPFSVGFRFNGF